MLHLLLRLKASFEQAVDDWFANAIGEPQNDPIPHIKSSMIISQTDETATVYTAAHMTGFAEQIPALIGFLQNADFEDAPQLLDAALPLLDSADKIIIDENPPGNFKLDKKLLVALRELAEAIQPYQVNLCSLEGIIDSAQMLCQNYHVGDNPPPYSQFSTREYLPKGYN